MAWCAALLMVVIASAATALQAQTDRPVRLPSFDCAEPFGRDITAAQLTARFGLKAVQTRPVYLGEGQTETGTLIFPDSEDEVEVLWKDAEAQRNPKLVRVRRAGSRWTTASGISIGVSLRDTERRNGRPFRLVGFGWDAGGTVMSWSNGRLTDAQDKGCRLRFRFAAKSSGSGGSAYEEVTGSGEFSSGHPAMQRLDPQVSQMWIDFMDRPPRNRR